MRNNNTTQRRTHAHTSVSNINSETVLFRILGSNWIWSGSELSCSIYNTKLINTSHVTIVICYYFLLLTIIILNNIIVSWYLYGWMDTSTCGFLGRFPRGFSSIERHNVLLNIIARDLHISWFIVKNILYLILIGCLVDKVFIVLASTNLLFLRSRILWFFCNIFFEIIYNLTYFSYLRMRH